MRENKEQPGAGAELGDAEAEKVVGGRLSVANLSVRGGGSRAQTENGDSSKKLYKISYDGGTDEDWGLTSG